MVKKIFFISLVLFGLLFFHMAQEYLAAENPPDPSTQLQQAETCKDNGDYEQAEAIYQAIVQNYPDTDYALEAQKKLVIFYTSTERSTEAQEALDKLVADFSLHPDLPAALYWVAREHRWLGKYDQAKSIYQQIIQQHPDTQAAARAQLGVSRINVLSLIKSEDDEAALLAVDELVTDFNDNPDLSETLYWLAKEYEWLWKYDQATYIYEQIIQKHASSYWAGQTQFTVRKLNIFSLIDLGQTEAAAAAIDGFIADFNDNPELPSELHWLARKYEDSRRYEQAKSLYEQIVQQYPDSSSAEMARLDAAKMDVLPLFQLGEDAAAWEAIDSLIADFNSNPYLPTAVLLTAEQCRYAALDLEQQELFTQAEDYLQKAAQIFEIATNELPNSPETAANACYWAGDCYHRLADYENALAYYQRVISNWPDDHMFAPFAQFMIGKCYEKLINTDTMPQAEAAGLMEQAYKTVIEYYPYSSAVKSASLELARLNYERDQWDQAVPYFEPFLQDCPENQRLYRMVWLLGRAYEERGQADKAIEIYSEFVQLVPPDHPRVKRIQTRLEELTATN